MIDAGLGSWWLVTIEDYVGISDRLPGPNDRDWEGAPTLLTSAALLIILTGFAQIIDARLVSWSRRPTATAQSTAWFDVRADPSATGSITVERNTVIRVVAPHDLAARWRDFRGMVVTPDLEVY